MSEKNLWQMMGEQLLGQDIAGQAAIKASKDGKNVEEVTDELIIDLIANHPNYASMVGTESFRYGLERGPHISNPGILRGAIIGENDE